MSCCCIGRYTRINDTLNERIIALSCDERTKIFWLSNYYVRHIRISCDCSSTPSSSSPFSCYYYYYCDAAAGDGAGDVVRRWKRRRERRNSPILRRVQLTSTSCLASYNNRPNRRNGEPTTPMASKRYWVRRTLPFDLLFSKEIGMII